MKALVIERKNLINNIKVIKSILNKSAKDNNKDRAKIIGVVKGNGYGMGLVKYTKFLIKNGIKYIAVATVEEALVLRKASIKESILLMSSTAIKKDLELLIKNNITITIGSKEAGDIANNIGKVIKKPVKAHIKIDTGFGRYGFLYNQKEDLLNYLSNWNNIKVEGIFSHFSTAFFKENGYTQKQFKRFMDCVNFLKENNIQTGMAHICNSSAFLKFYNMHLDAVRVGSVILGRVPFKTNVGLKRVGFLKSRVAEIKTLPKKHYISYSNAYRTKKETKIAIIPCGYADGFYLAKKREIFTQIDKFKCIIADIKRSIKKQQAQVEINGIQCDIIGRIGMSNVVVDITDKNVKINDEARFNINPILVDSFIRREYI